jgi:hypothetical protein
MLRPRSSSSDESGGVVIAPDGIRESFTGEGDWRMLPLTEEPRELAFAASPPLATAWTLAAVLSAVENDGVLRFGLFRYDVDERERGREGRGDEAEDSGLVST